MKAALQNFSTRFVSAVVRAAGALCPDVHAHAWAASGPSPVLGGRVRDDDGWESCAVRDCRLAKRNLLCDSRVVGISAWLLKLPWARSAGSPLTFADRSVRATRVTSGPSPVLRGRVRDDNAL